MLQSGHSGEGVFPFTLCFSFDLKQMTIVSDLTADFKKNLNTLAGKKYSSPNVRVFRDAKRESFGLFDRNALICAEFVTDDQKVALFDLSMRTGLSMREILSDKSFETEKWDDEIGTVYEVPTSIYGMWDFGLMKDGVRNEHKIFGGMLQDGSIHT